MKFQLALGIAAVLTAAAVIAQTASQQAPAQHQPATPASPSVQGSQAQTPPAKVDPEKEKAIRRLMDLNGSAKLADNMTEAMAFQVKTAMSRNLPADRLEKFMDDFNAKLSSRSPATEVANAEVSNYAQHFTMDDLHGMIQFYESPVGQRMAKSLPEVMQESQRSAADIERTAAIATLKDMSDQYPELKSMLPGEQRPSLGPGAQPQQPQSPKPQSPDQQPNPPKPQN